MSYCYRLLVVFAVCCFFFAARGHGAKRKHSYAHSSRSDYNERDIIDSDWGATTYFVPNIKPEKIGIAGLEIDDPFNEEKALFAVFPGNHYDVHDDSGKEGEGFAIWRSTAYPQKKEEDDHYFPMRKGNLTQVFETFPFKDDSGSRHVLVVFETNEPGPLNELYMGNCMQADMSLAMFSKKGNKWALTCFTLAAAYMGTYQHLPHDMHLIKLGQNNYGLEVGTECYNPGGPGWGDTHIFGIVDGQFKQILMNGHSTKFMSMPCGNWGTQVTRRNTGLVFDDLKVVTDGDFCRDGYDSHLYTHYSYGDVPAEIQHKAAEADSFGFVITRTFHFDKGTYRLVSAKTRTTGVKPLRKN